MKIDREVLQHLNRALGQELISINQYFLHARVLKNWGFEGLGKAIYKKSIDDMIDADEIIERILLLEGLPNLQELGKLLIGENVPEIIACDLKREYAKREIYVAAIEICETHQDYVSREILTKQLDKSEDHIDWLETQEELIDIMTLENYLQSAIDQSFEQ